MHKDLKDSTGTTDDEFDNPPKITFDTFGIVTYFIHNPSNTKPWYNAPSGSSEAESINFKVELKDDGKWHCAKNGKCYDECRKIYCLKFYIQDDCGQKGRIRVTAFGEVAEKLLGGVPAQTLFEYLQENKKDQYEEVFANSCYKRFKFRLVATATTTINKQNQNKETIISYMCTNVQAQPKKTKQYLDHIFNNLAILYKLNNQNMDD